jgi:2-hydroxy-3-oxopropionate reductase
MHGKQVGVIGLGDMGLPMARRLLRHGVTVFSCANRRREAIKELKSEGLVERPDPRTVAAQVSTLLSVVVDEQQTDTVLRGPQGALQALEPGSVIVVMSTVSPGYCQSLAAEAEQRGIAVLDCPITGGNIAAEKGTLGLLVGGSTAALEQCRDVLTPLGTVYHCGGIGMGQIAKLANNAIAFTTTAAVDEARSMALAYGMDLRVLMKAIGHGTGQCFAADKWDFVATQWEHLRPLGKKDVGLFLQAAKGKGLCSEVIETMFASEWQIKSDPRAR